MKSKLKVKFAQMLIAYIKHQWVRKMKLVVMVMHLPWSLKPEAMCTMVLLAKLSALRLHKEA